MRKKSNTQIAYNKIKEMIANQELLPQQQLLELDLASRFGMSRTPIREAIRLLKEEGLVDIIPNRGAFIKGITKSDLLMGFEAIEGLEGMACYLIAERVKEGTLTADDLNIYDHYIQDMKTYLNEGRKKDWAECDRQFHTELISLCRNRFIIQERQKLLDLMNQILWLVTPATVDKSVSNREHEELLTAIKKGNPELARKTAQDQMRGMRERLQEIL